MGTLVQSPTGSVVVAVALIAFLCYRQTTPRPVEEERGMKLVILFGLLGVAQLVSALGAHATTNAAVVCILTSFILAGVLGALRGSLIAVYRERDALMHKGNATTVILWLIGLAVHFGMERIAQLLDPSAESLGGTTLLLEVVLSLGVQKYVVLQRGKQQEANPSDHAA